MRRLAAMTLAAGLAVLLPAIATACPRTSLGAVEHEVMCLECGVPLDEATNSIQAERERAFIVRLIARCKTKSQIKSALVAQYGDRVLGSPRAKGFGITAYWLPVAAFLAAATAVVLAALRWRRRRQERTAPPAADPADAARLEADIRAYDL